MTRRPRVSQLLALTVGLLALFAVAGLIAGLAALGSLADNRRLVVDRLDPALVSAQQFQISLADQETGVRGYVLSRDPSFLAPYRAAVRQGPGILADLYRTAGRRQVVQDIAVAARAWQSRYAEPTVAAVRAGRRPPPARRGKVLFDAFRGRVSRFTAVVGRERRAARRELSRAARRVRELVLAFAVAIFLATLATALVLRRTVVSPLERLAERVRRTTSGDYEEPITVRGGAREVHQLGEDVDAMRARVLAERDELQRSNAELEQFAYVASHDLQEPLRKVASFTQMLQRRYEGQLDERADQYIGFAVDGAKRMQDLINDLLAFSRVGRVMEGMVPVDLNVAVQHAMTTLSGRLRAESARVEVDDLPTVMGEPSLLELVFANLISNGIKFRREDVDPVVRLAVERRGDEWCFTASDNGIGIDPEYADRIFVIFQRLHPRSAYEGTGIGLAMCRKIIEYHGGRIWFDTGRTDGATFRFSLPAINEETP